MGEPTFDFGADINSTSISNLQMAPMVTSRSDPSAPPPLTPPIYNPNVDPPPQKHVTFDEPIERGPSRGSNRNRKRDKRDKRDKRESYQPDAYQPVAFAQPPLPAAPVEKKKRLFLFLQEYRRSIMVFVLVAALLWYYPKLTQMPYVGSPPGLSMLGSLAVPAAAALVFGSVDYVLD